MTIEYKHLCVVACKKEKSDCRHKMTYSRVREAENKGLVVIAIVDPCTEWEAEDGGSR